MKHTSRIEAALPERLHTVYHEQLAAVRTFVGDADEEVALPRLEAAMKQVFAQAFGLSAEASQALAYLAAHLPGESDQPRLAVAIQRCALQRALAAGGMAAGLRPHYAVAARAALDALGLPDSRIVVHDPSTRVHRLPTLPPIHHQNTDLEDAGHSRLFAMKWE